MPLGFSTATKGETQPIASFTGAIMSGRIIRCSSCFSFFFRANGTLRGGVMVDFTFGSTVKW